MQASGRLFTQNNFPEKLLKKLLTIQSFSGKLFSCSEPIKLNTDAALAQLVERRLGKAEVGGSNPLGSFKGISDQRFLFYFLPEAARSAPAEPMRRMEDVYFLFFFKIRW